MKNIALTSSFILLYLTTIGQPSSYVLPTDESGMVTFSKVVEVGNTSSEILFQNALSFLQTTVDDHENLKNGPFINDDRTEITLPLAYTVYNDFPIHSPHGLIKYELVVSVKDSRYRYLATGFTFHYLKRNRYGKFVEVKGKTKSLEDPDFKGKQKLWDKHRQQVAEKVQQFTQELQAAMTMLPAENSEEEIVKVDDNW